MKPVPLVGPCRKCQGKGFLELDGGRWRGRCDSCKLTTGWLTASTAAIWAWDAGDVKEEEETPPP